MIVLSIFILIIAFLWGYFEPWKTGWLLILLVPLLYPSLWIIVPSTIIPVTVSRFGFAALLGIISSNYQNVSIKKLFKIRFVKIFLLFSLLLILSSLRDSPKFVLATYLLQAWFGIGLGFVMIRSLKDLDKLFKIMVWQAAIIGFLIVVEYYTSFNYVLLLRNTAHQIDASKFNSSYMRSGVYRPMGIDGNSVQTAYRLAFLFPLVLWYSLKGKVVNFIPIILVSIGLIFLQTRVSYIGITLSMAILIYYIFIKNKSKEIRKQLLKIIILSVIALVVVFYFWEGPYQIAVHFFDSFLGANTTLSIEQDQRGRFVFIALKYIFKNSLWGYGSPSYVYYDLMGGMDLPAPVLYFLVGGVFFFILYLYLLYIVSFNLLKYIKRIKVSQDLERKALFLSIGLIAGNAVLFVNWQEAHILIMYLLYIATVKQVLYHTNTLGKLYQEFN